MSDEAIKGKRKAQSVSPTVEKALQELAHMPVTEACVCGACDLCLNRAALCDVASPQPQDSYQPRPAAEKKTKP